MLHTISQKIRKLFSGRPFYKDGENKEKLAKLYYLVIARTGIATYGSPKVIKVLPSPFVPIREDLLLQITASAETQAEHPIAVAIVKEAQDSRLHLSDPRRFVYLPGMGVEAYLGDKKIHVGNKSLMDKKLVEIDALSEKSSRYLKEGNIVLFVAIDGNFVGLIVLHDEHNERIVSTIKALHDLGISVALMTADHREMALVLAEKLGIQRVIAGISADEKPQEIVKLLREEKYVAKLGKSHHSESAFGAADLSILHGNGKSSDFDVSVDNIEDLLEKIKEARDI